VGCFVCVILMCGSVRAQINCYTCSSDPNNGADIGSCRVVGSATNSGSNCAVCSTSVQPAANGALFYTRKCETVSTAPGCTLPGSIPTTCYCNTSMCNSNALLTVGTLNCYSCSSSYPIDNGCGEKIVAPGNGVNTAVVQVSGCTTCTKSVTPGTNGPTYSRGCGHVYETNDYCGQSASVGCNFKCYSNLCNTSTRLVSLGSSTALLAALLLVLSLFA